MSRFREYVLERNIVHGDALSLKTVDGKRRLFFSNGRRSMAA